MPNGVLLPCCILISSLSYDRIGELEQFVRNQRRLYNSSAIVDITYTRTCYYCLENFREQK